MRTVDTGGRPSDRFANRVVVVTGGGAGIGQAIAQRFAAERARVVVNDIDADAANAVAGAIELATGEKSVAVPADVTRPDGAAAVLNAAVGAFGGVDVWVNNAAAYVELRPFMRMSEVDWDAAMSSYYAVLHCTKAVLPTMIERRYGRIVNVTSLGGDVGVPEMSVYCAAKGATHALTRAVAKEVASDGVTVNCVAPGTVDTPRQRSRPAEVRRQRQARIPVGRFADSEEIAHAAAFLADEASAYITGEVLFVDGGRP